MITYPNEVLAAWRWYHLLLTSRAWPVVGLSSALRAASYACAGLFHRAVLGRPTPSGPHQVSDALMWSDLTTNQKVASDGDLGRWLSASVRLLPSEAELLCAAMGKIYVLAQASEIGPVARLTLQESVLYYDPILGRWTDGFLHQPEQSLLKGTLHRVELALDDPESPAADWERLARVYADGELHRHLGWAQGTEAKEAEPDGQQAAEVRDRRVPDEARADDQVAG